MNPAFVYRRHGRCIFWIAFMSALAIHLGAVALAKTKSPPATLEDFNPPGDVELVDTAEPEPALLEESGHASAVRADSPGSGHFSGGESHASTSSRASQGTASIPCQRNNGLVAFCQSNGGVCAAPSLSVRSPPPTSNRIGRRVAQCRSNLGHCD